MKQTNTKVPPVNYITHTPVQMFDTDEDDKFDLKAQSISFLC